MLELQITDNDVSSGSAQVSWCVDAEILKELADEQIKEPQLVIVVAPNGEAYDKKKEVRKVVPLKDLMTYMEFRTAGLNKVWGVVSYSSKKEACKRYLGKEDGAFSTDILDYDGEGYSLWLRALEEADAQQSKQYKNLSPPVSVEVPAGIFAPEPPAWEKIWVNHFFRNKVVDQCDFRRRRLFAYLVQPFLIGGKMLATFVVLLAGLLTGARSWSIKYLLHPLTYGPGDAVEIWEGGTIFIRHQPEDNDPGFPSQAHPPTPWYMLRSFWPLPFMPVFVITATLLTYFHKFPQLIATGIVLGALAAVIMLVITLMAYSEQLFFWAPRFPCFLFGCLIRSSESLTLTCGISSQKSRN